MSNELYDERARVVVALALASRALGYRIGFAVDPKEPDWPVLFIDLPTGQVSWHLTQAQRVDLAGDIGDYGGVWDGHSTTEKYERLRAWRPPLVDRVGQINRILRDWWNPIGFDEDLPDDEYEAYAWTISGFTRLGEVPITMLHKYLSHVRRDVIGLLPDEQADHKVAVSLFRLMSSWK